MHRPHRSHIILAAALMLSCDKEPDPTIPPVSVVPPNPPAPISPLPPVFPYGLAIQTPALGTYGTGVAVINFTGSKAQALVFGNGNDMGPQAMCAFVIRNTKDIDDLSTQNRYPDWYSPRIEYNTTISAGDLDDDGALDMTVGQSFGRYRKPIGAGIDVYINRDQVGREMFDPPFSVMAQRPIAGQSLGDVNGDGLLDLIVTLRGKVFQGIIPSGAPITIYLNQGQRRFPATPDWTSTWTDYAPSVVAADVNQDGWMDIVLSSTTTAVFYGHDPTVDAPLFSPEPNWLGTEKLTFSYSVGVARLRPDEALSLVVTDTGYDTASNQRVLLYTPEGHSSAPRWQAELLRPTTALLGDLDRDGALDIAVATLGQSPSVGGPLFIYAGGEDGMPKSEPWTSTSITSGQGMGFSDLGHRMRQSVTERFKVASPRAVFTTQRRILESITAVRINDTLLARSEWAWVWGENNVSLGSALQAGDVVEIDYDWSPVHDIIIANWSPDAGNLVFESTVGRG